MCKVLNVSTSGFYAWAKRLPSARALEDQHIAKRIGHHFDASLQAYGTVRLKRALNAEGIVVSRARIGRLMNQLGLVAKAQRVKAKKRTTRTDPNFSAPVNLLKQDFRARNKDEVWVADITYVKIDQGWIYVATVMDLFSRKIVGWSIEQTLETSLALNALKMAILQRQPGAGLVHHSDRGCQYSSKAYQQALARRRMVCSMSGKGNCYDNAPMESFFGTFKVEVEIERFKKLSMGKAKQDIFKYIEIFYNRKRQHSAIGFMSPFQFEQQHAL